MLVLIIGGRYGSEASSGNAVNEHDFYDRYESITKKEFTAAIERDIPVFIMIERSVNAEYRTFMENRERTDINYAHVDSVNIFHLIRDILAKPRNNPVQPFDNHLDIIAWLRNMGRPVSGYAHPSVEPAPIDIIGHPGSAVERSKRDIASLHGASDGQGVARRGRKIN